MLTGWPFDTDRLEGLTVSKLIALVEGAQYEVENPPYDPKCDSYRRLAAAEEYHRQTGKKLVLLAEDVDAVERETEAREKERISREEWMLAIAETPEGRNMMRICREVSLSQEADAKE